LRGCGHSEPKNFGFGLRRGKKIGTLFKKFYPRRMEEVVFRLQNFLGIFSKQYIFKTFKSNKQVNKIMESIKLLVVATLMIAIIPIAANSEFLPGVEGVWNITWGNPEKYPEGYYKDGYPVEGNK